MPGLKLMTISGRYSNHRGKCKGSIGSRKPGMSHWRTGRVTCSVPVHPHCFFRLRPPISGIPITRFFLQATIRRCQLLSFVLPFIALGINSRNYLTTGSGMLSPGTPCISKTLSNLGMAALPLNRKRSGPLLTILKMSTRKTNRDHCRQTVRQAGGDPLRSENWQLRRRLTKIDTLNFLFGSNNRNQRFCRSAAESNIP